MKLLERSWIVFLLWFALFVVALITTAPLFFTLTYMLGGILILSLLWAWVNIRWVKIIRKPRTYRSHVGEIIEERFYIENTGYLPKLWLELEDHSTLPAHRAGYVVSSLGPKQTHTRIVRTMCLQRGRFRLGTTTIISGDPFGLFTTERWLNVSSNIIVYPRTVPLPYFEPLLGEITGGEAIHRRTHYVTTNVSGVRDYAPGDSFNRIHWPSTARTNRLIVKEFELDPFADVWLVLDMERNVHPESDYELSPDLIIPEVPWESWSLPDIAPSTEEYSVVITGSLVRHFLQQDRTVGLVTYANGIHCEFIQSDRGLRQEDRLLEILSVMHPYGTVSLDQVLIAQGVRFTRNTTLIVITPSPQAGWVAAARHLTSRGVKVTAIFVNPESFGVPFDATEIISELYTNHIPHYVVNKGDKLDEVLANKRL